MIYSFSKYTKITFWKKHLIRMSQYNLVQEICWYSNRNEQPMHRDEEINYMNLFKSTFTKMIKFWMHFYTIEENINSTKWIGLNQKHAFLNCQSIFQISKIRKTQCIRFVAKYFWSTILIQIYFPFNTNFYPLYNSKEKWRSNWSTFCLFLMRLSFVLFSQKIKKKLKILLQQILWFEISFEDFIIFWSI